MTLGQNGVLRYMATLVSFWSILVERMANFGLIDFKLVLYIKVNVNTNFKLISNKLAKMAINWHKIGQMPVWQKNIKFGITWSFFVQFLHSFFRMVTITKLYDL